MKISIVVAVSRNGVIGRNGNIPWRLGDDLRHFKEITKGHNIVMGRKTYESLPDSHRPLPDRTNIVLTRNLFDFQRIHQGKNVVACPNIDIVLSTLDEYNKECFIIGGSSLYRMFLPFASKVYLTIVDSLTKGDTFLPYFDEKEFNLIKENRHYKSNSNEYDFVIRYLERKEKSYKKILETIRYNKETER